VVDRLRRQIAALDRKWSRSRPEPSAPAAPSREIDLPGRRVEADRGAVRVVEARFPLGFRHGGEPVGRFAEPDAPLADLRRLYRCPGSLDPATMVFLDTETTGLSGGAGTLPFLVGVGYLHEGAFVVEQVFLDHPRDEPAMVAHLARTLARFEQAVTYNGRAFDLPLMQNRFVLQRTPWPGLGEMLDLLPGTRRLHRRHLDDRSLGSVERNLLGFAREGDVPGSEIPGIYHRFLLTRRSDGVAEVLRHNLWDVLAMAALIGFQADLLGERRPAGAIDPAVDVALGELHGQAGESDRAEAAFARAIARWESDPDRRGDAGIDALRCLARLCRRQRRHDRAADCWSRVLLRRPGDGEAHLALAKHHEHRTGDLAAAIRHARAARAAGVERGVDADRRLERIAARGAESRFRG
jgi:hypothetical protein